MTHPLLDERSAGLLLHPTSLPGPLASGDLGPAAYRFVDFLKDSGCTFWQMLPIHPIGGGDSPYDSCSAFAGAPHLVSLELLADEGLLDASELRTFCSSRNKTSLEGPRHADLTEGLRLRSEWMRRAFSRLSDKGRELGPSYHDFVEREKSWLWDFALFLALKNKYQGAPWFTFEPALRRREPEALSQAHRELEDEVLYRVLEQYCFDRQWATLKQYASERGIRLMGDIPMFVAHDSVDVWANQHMFFLDEAGQRTVQAGVPPDYFSEDGQLWGNPLYRWDVMQRDGYGWWIDRLRRELRRFDVIRLDHFIAFSRYWEVSVSETTAKNGRYVAVPGYDFFQRAEAELGALPFVAEDLGIITPDVELLRDSLGLPGMKILQFAFSPGAEAYLPYRHPARSVVYTGTHDNDTTAGYVLNLTRRAGAADDSAQAAAIELERLTAWTGTNEPVAAAEALVRILFASPANTAIIPVQDLLGLGSEDRMNVPGIAQGNWGYRLSEGELTPAHGRRLHTLLSATGRTVT